MLRDRNKISKGFYSQYTAIIVLIMDQGKFLDSIYSFCDNHEFQDLYDMMLVFLNWEPGSVCEFCYKGKGREGEGFKGTNPCLGVYCREEKGIGEVSLNSQNPHDPYFVVSQIFFLAVGGGGVVGLKFKLFFYPHLICNYHPTIFIRTPSTHY